MKLNSGKIFRQEEKLPFSASETFFEEFRKTLAHLKLVFTVFFGVELWRSNLTPRYFV